MCTGLALPHSPYPRWFWKLDISMTRKDSLKHTLALVAVAALGALLAWIGRGRR